MLAALDREGRVGQQPLVAGGDAEAVRLDDRAAAARRLEEVEAERAALARQQLELAARVRALGLEALDLRQLRLRLLGLALLVAEPLDEALEPHDVGADPLCRLRRVGGAGRLLEPPDVPRPGEEERAAGLELEHAGRDRLEEPAVVRDEDHGRVERLQLLLEPLQVLDVEVVRRLVEQQQVGIAGERAGQRGARQLAAGEGRQLPVEVALREAEAAQRRRRPVAPGVAAGVLEPRLGLGVAAQRRLVVVAGRHRLLEPAQLLLGLDQVARARERVLAQRQAAVERRPLVVQRDPRALGEGELAAVDLALADEHPQQRRLAGAVRTGQRQAVAALDGERDSLEEQRAGELLAQVGSGDDGHALSVCGCSRWTSAALRPGLAPTTSAVASSASPPAGPTRRATGRDGSAELDADELVAACEAVLAEAGGGRTRPGSRASGTACCCSTATTGPLTPVLLWQDRRSAAQAEELRGAARPGARARPHRLLPAPELLAGEARVAAGAGHARRRRGEWSRSRTTSSCG